MKRLISMVLITVVIISCIFFVNNISFSKEQENIDDVFEKKISENKISVDLAAERIDKDNFVFSSIYTEKTILPQEDFDDILSYVRFIIKNNLGKDEILYINSLLHEGYRLRLISEVYDFWLTTNEDIDFIGRCLEVSHNFWGEHWIENAFNNLTDNKCGVLETKEEIQEYLDKGLTTYDIYNANILCRKGIYTITELLQMRLEGLQWAEICLKVSPKDVYQYSLDADDISVLNIHNEQQVKALMEKFYISDKETLFKKISDTKNKLEEYLEEKCIEKMTQLNISCDESDEGYTKDDNLKQKIFSNGLTTKDINLLFKKGFEYEEIYDISEMVKKDRDITIYDAAKEVFGGEQ